MRIAIATTSILLALASQAAAQPSMEPVQPAKPAAPPAAKPLSESTALGLSIGFTVGSWAALAGSVYLPEHPTALPILLCSFGAAIAPSAGNFYAGTYLTRGLALRSVGTLAALFGAASVPGGFEELGPYVVYGVLGAGLALYAIGTIDDLVTTPGRVRRKNRELGLTIAPAVTPGSTGILLGGRF